MQAAHDLSVVRRAPSLADQIYRQLKELLRTGAFAPAERLVDATLAQRLAVSRTPVREAMNRLAADGFLETRAGGFQVVTPTDADMAEIFEMRRLLEPPAAVQAARLGGAPMRIALHDALSRARTAAQAADVTAFAAANSTFREAWASQVPNRRLRETILRFNDQAGLVRRRTLVMPEARAEALALLEKIVAAFDKRDEAGVAQLTAQFVDAAERFFRLAAESVEGPAAPARRTIRTKS
jgi:DNA-binding GntR family transcriptional regulator